MTLIDIEDKAPNWVLDRQTREVGLKGVALARTILQTKVKSKDRFTPNKSSHEANSERAS